ncbi:MAG TPA: glycosyltransferase family 39 protein, partial [Blastocatellia bacterium]|nr:glycosyltransferase family 39 protein [Blastocatellia bacterium]
QRWTSPIIDHGRELNLPARLLTGEQLYVDVHYLYGPLAPHLNALLYGIFGTHLSVLHFSGMLCGAIILVLVYAIARQLMPTVPACLTVLMVLVVCAIKATANYIMPYSFGALYALVFALGALLCSIVYVRRKNRWWLGCAGLLSGAVLTSKLEITLPAIAAAGLAWCINSFQKRKIQWFDLALLILPLVLINFIVFGLVLKQVPLNVLLEDNRLLFTNMPEQLYYFNQRVSGLADWPRGLAASIAGSTLWIAVCGLCALIGLLIAKRNQAQSNKSQERWHKPLIASLSGFILWALIVFSFNLRSDASPLTGGLLLLIAIIVWAGWRVVRQQDARAPVMLIISIFALGSIARVFLNVTVSSTYSPFFLPAVIIVYLYVLFEIAPKTLLNSKQAQKKAVSAAVVLMLIAVIATAFGTARRVRRKYNYQVITARGSFYTTQEIGLPAAQILRWIETETLPEDHVLIIPQGTSLNFLSARRSPFAEEILLPGFVAGEAEQQAIQKLDAERVPWIIIENFPSDEFQQAIFGRDYNQQLVEWINQKYVPVAKFPNPAHQSTASDFSLTIYKLEPQR